MLATPGDDANTVETDTTILKSVSIVVGNLNILPPVFDSVKTVTLFEETTPMIQVRVFTNYSTVTFSLFLQFIGESELRPPSPARLRSRSLPQKRADPVIVCPVPAATALNEIVFQGMSSWQTKFTTGDKFGDLILILYHVWNNYAKTFDFSWIQQMIRVCFS